MNKVILCGRLTAEPEIRYSQNQESTCVARGTLAVDRKYKTEDANADFPTYVAFGKTAEFLEKYGKKGTKFIVVGRLQTGSYTNKDGARVYTTDVVVEECEFAESKKTNEPKEDNEGWSQIGGFPVEEEDGDLPFAKPSR